MDLTFKVTGERYLVKQNNKKEKSKGGILIPTQSREEQRQGIIIEAGHGALLDNGEHTPMFCVIGDSILFTEFSGTPIGTKEESFLILNQRDILAIIKVVDDKTFVLPLGERYVIEQYKTKQETDSGIVIPDKFVEKQYQGNIIAKGNGIYLGKSIYSEMLYETSQSVLFTKFAGTPILVDDKEYLIINQRDILCVVETEGE